MQSPLHNTKVSQDYQLSFSKIKEKVLLIYNEFVPEQIKNRRNIEQQIQPDFIIISAIIWATMQGFTTQIAKYKAICSMLFHDDFPENSRYYRICGLLNRSLAGFEAKLEVILLTYSFPLKEAQKIVPGTLKYSLGYF